MNATNTMPMLEKMVRGMAKERFAVMAFRINQEEWKILGCDKEACRYYSRITRTAVLEMAKFNPDGQKWALVAPPAVETAWRILYRSRDKPDAQQRFMEHLAKTNAAVWAQLGVLAMIDAYDADGLWEEAEKGVETGELDEGGYVMMGRIVRALKLYEDPAQVLREW